MAVKVYLEFAYSDYSSLDDSTTLPVGLTSREAAICASILQLLQERAAWQATDSEYDDIQETIAVLIEDVQSAI